MKNNEKLLWLMKNADGEVRNGWWIALFVLLVAITQPIYGFLRSTFKNAGATEYSLELIPIALILCVSFVCLKARREGFRDMGLSISGRSLSLFLLGAFLASVQLTFIMGAIYLFGGISFEFNDSIVIPTLLAGGYLVLLTATFEEILLRGFVFQRLVNGLGIVWAQLIIAAFFAIGHWDNPEMDGITKVIASINLGLGSLVLGYAIYKTKNLFMPIGIHFAWNFVMGRIYGAGVSGFEKEGLLVANLNDVGVWVTGGKFGPEASIFATIAELGVLLILLKWKTLRPVSDQPSISNNKGVGAQSNVLSVEK